MAGVLELARAAWEGLKGVDNILSGRAFNDDHPTEQQGEQPRDQRTGRYEPKPQGGGDDSDRLTLDDLQRDHAMCEYCGTPSQRLGMPGRPGEYAWGCPNDHSGMFDGKPRRRDEPALPDLEEPRL